MYAIFVYCKRNNKFFTSFIHEVDFRFVILTHVAYEIAMISSQLLISQDPLPACLALLVDRAQYTHIP